MKIFLSFLQSAKKHPIPAYDFWEFYMKNGIEEAGYQYSECKDVDWAWGLVPQSKTDHAAWKEEAWSKTVAELKKNPADLFLSYLYPHQIDVTAIRQIQAMGIPCVNFFCDNVREFTKAPVEFGAFNLNWVPEHKAIKIYQKSGYAYINLPMPMWIAPRLRVLTEESNKQITFIGSKDIQRQLFFEHVIANEPELPLAIYGRDWKENSTAQLKLPANYTLDKKIMHQYHFIKKNGITAYLRKVNSSNISQPATSILKTKIHEAPGFERYNDLIAGSMITVGINRYPSFRSPLFKPDTYSRLRDIEAPMLGACYLTEYTEGIEDLYVIGKEIEVFNDVAGFIEKAKALAADNQKRKSIKINGQKRALHDHSIPLSLTKIMQKLMH